MGVQEDLLFERNYDHEEGKDDAYELHILMYEAIVRFSREVCMAVGSWIY